LKDPRGDGDLGGLFIYICDRSQTLITGLGAGWKSSLIVKRKVYNFTKSNLIKKSGNSNFD
jgi:hypothetical protein